MKGNNLIRSAQNALSKPGLIQLTMIEDIFITKTDCVGDALTQRYRFNASSGKTFVVLIMIRNTTSAITLWPALRLNLLKNYRRIQRAFLFNLLFFFRASKCIYLCI